MSKARPCSQQSTHCVLCPPRAQSGAAACSTTFHRVGEIEVKDPRGGGITGWRGLPTLTGPRSAFLLTLHSHSARPHHHGPTHEAETALRGALGPTQGREEAEPPVRADVPLSRGLAALASEGRAGVPAGLRTLRLVFTLLSRHPRAPPAASIISAALSSSSSGLDGPCPLSDTRLPWLNLVLV